MQPYLLNFFHFVQKRLIYQYSVFLRYILRALNFLSELALALDQELAGIFDAVQTTRQFGVNIYLFLLNSLSEIFALFFQKFILSHILTAQNRERLYFGIKAKKAAFLCFEITVADQEFCH